MNHSRPGLPVAMLLFSRIPTALLRAGFPVGRLYLLDTPGRRTGALRTVPMRIFRHDGRRWLVSIFGETGWVTTIRAGRYCPPPVGDLSAADRLHASAPTGRRAEVAMQLR